MLVFVGDLHLQDNYLWSHELCQGILSWMSSASYNTPNNTLVLLGDLTESHLNSGAVYDYLKCLFESLKYKRIYIVVGNHDVRRRAGKETTPYDFLKTDRRVIICSTPGEVVSIEGFSCLMLPHFLPTQERPSVNKFYATLSGKYDFVIGHVADETAAMIPESQRTDLSKLEGIKVLGHIHTRTSPNYIGSVYAGTIKETEDKRAVWIFDKDKTKTEEPIPVFTEYQNVTYPAPILRSKSLISIYTFFGADEKTIRETYGQVHIRRIVRNLDSNLKTDLSKASKLTSLKDAKDTKKLIQSWNDSLKEKPSDRLLMAIHHYAF
jgi:calcineurin-like phosphoesterase family protein